MSDRISIDDAQGKLKDLIAGMAPGAELVITDHEQPIAKLVAEPAKLANQHATRRGGQLKGQIVIAPGFDQLPADIAEAFGAGEE
ncbi:type II toxin-antitoxin system Phd/YefM family antitoxin [Novipirellula sp. SH528]|uniref:type II toxin-antitoxin system Phd/YefM family antitoxin n=1 Tax=Novipirellula sp. SH528 TaxID=3454466 RepID=UPI003FA0F9F7